MRTLKTIPGRARSASWLAVAGLAMCFSTGAVQSQESRQNAPTPPANAPYSTQATSTSPTATTSSSEVQVPAPNSPVLIVDMRSETDIQMDLDGARALKPTAQADEQRAGGDVIQSKATLEIEKKDLEALKTRRDVAKKAGDKSEVATLDRQKEKEELGIKLLERFVAVRECQVELGRARRDFADASILALESELAMSKKRTAWDSLTQPGGAGASAQSIVALQVDIRSDEHRVLKAMKERSERGEEVAKKESELIQRQIDVLEADTAIQQFATRAH